MDRVSAINYEETEVYVLEATMLNWGMREQVG